MVASYTPLLTKSVAAAAELVGERFVDIDGNYAAAGKHALGVSRTDAAAGDMASVIALGSAVVEAGGAIGAGELVEVGTDGKAIALASGQAVGRAIDAATTDGDRIEVLLLPSQTPMLTTPITAAADLLAERFVDASGNYATAAAYALGVTEAAVANGASARVIVMGTAVVVAAEAISAGAKVEVGANGKAAALDAGVAVARALEDAAEDGDRIRVLLLSN